MNSSSSRVVVRMTTDVLLYSYTYTVVHMYVVRSTTQVYIHATGVLHCTPYYPVSLSSPDSKNSSSVVVQW